MPSFGTQAVHAGEENIPYRPSSMPIYQTSTYTFESVGEAAEVIQGSREGFVYTRIGNPTVQAFERKLAVLEGAASAVSFASGMAALSAVFQELLRPGDEIISSSHIYAGTRGLFGLLQQREGCRTRFFDPEDDIRKTVPRLINKKTRLIFFETPSNPELSIIDISRIAALAKKHSLVSVTDNTFATPYLQQPLRLGVDCVVHSATKYIGGHGDAIGGAAAGTREFIARLRKRMLLYGGACLSPFNAWLYLRGLKTLHVRMDRHCRTAAEIADFLSASPKVEEVLYPGLPGHRGHRIARRQMSGFGGVVSFRLKSRAACRTVLDRLQLCRTGVSLGDVETLVMNGALMFHPDITDAACRKIGVEPTLIRVSTGLEDAGDIIADLKTALAAL